MIGEEGEDAYGFDKVFAARPPLNFGTSFVTVHGPSIVE
jgi:hypothetical protein